MTQAPPLTAPGGIGRGERGPPRYGRGSCQWERAHHPDRAVCRGAFDGRARGGPLNQRPWSRGPHFSCIRGRGKRIQTRASWRFLRASKRATVWARPGHGPCGTGGQKPWRRRPPCRRRSRDGGFGCHRACGDRSPGSVICPRTPPVRVTAQPVQRRRPRQPGGFPPAARPVRYGPRPKRGQRTYAAPSAGRRSSRTARH